MEHTAPHGGVTKSPSEQAGYRGAGTMIEPGRYVERPGLDERIGAAGQDVAGVRRMLASTGAKVTCPR